MAKADADERVAWAPLRAALVAWYDRSARDLPWRRTRDPYAIWVSEIMLQQTRVETVVRYYDRFLQRFPTPEALACAAEDEVMAAWSGLGYYRRARNLHRGVREVVERYGGSVPEAPEARRALPGVGRYTAGAIGSIAFDREEPIVDGNVARVLCRVLDLQTPLAQPRTQARLWRAAEQLVRGTRPSALNQALMELGATVCTKQSPDCARCPLRGACRAHAAGRAHALPVASPKRAPSAVALVALVATRTRERELELWLGKGDGTLFGGLWNLPMLEGHGRAAAGELLRSSGLRARLPPRSPSRIEHVLTHRRLSLELWPAEQAQPRAGQFARQALRAVPLRELDALGVSQLTRKALAAVGLGAQPQLPLR